jgi:mannose-1-phosphate guanylyltransferase
MTNHLWLEMDAEQDAVSWEYSLEPIRNPDGSGVWAVLLAGGDGHRLQSLTSRITGDARPKQFCCLFGEQSLLLDTKQRIEPMFEENRTLFLVTRAHERYYKPDLSGVADANIITQPLNRGTGVAIASAVLHVLGRDADAVIAFFPCDHYYSDNEAFRATLTTAFAAAQQNPASIVLLGAEASYPETDYGWIEARPGKFNGRGGNVRRVTRFWEKPSFPQAQGLLRRGCLWNTFVSVGRADAYLQLLCAEAPDVVQGLSAGMAEADLDCAYQALRALDFSREVLTQQAHRLLVLSDAASGWADLGGPTRAIDILARRNGKSPWFADLFADPQGIRRQGGE